MQSSSYLPAISYHDYIRLILPTSHDLRELHEVCSAIPPTVVAPTRVYPVKFDIQQVIRDTIPIAASARTRSHAIQAYVMNLHAESLYLIDPAIQQQVSTGITHYIVRLMEIFQSHNLYEPNGSFHWKFHEFNPNTFNITLIKERPYV